MASWRAMPRGPVSNRIQASKGLFRAYKRTILACRILGAFCRRHGRACVVRTRRRAPPTHQHASNRCERGPGPKGSTTAMATKRPNAHAATAAMGLASWSLQAVQETAAERERRGAHRRAVDPTNSRTAIAGGARAPPAPPPPKPLAADMSRAGRGQGPELAGLHNVPAERVGPSMLPGNTNSCDTCLAEAPRAAAYQAPAARAH